jgi:hypothetical protein
MDVVKSCLCMSVAIVGCGVSNSQEIKIGQANTLGAVSIAIDRLEVDGDNVFELHGLDAAGNQVASVQLRTGTISDLPDYLPGPTSFGSEIIFAAGGNHRRFISRETRVHDLAPISDPTIQAFVQLPVVSATLAHEAKIVVAPELSEEKAYTYPSYASCTPGDLLNSPVAQQCCESVNEVPHSDGPFYITMFIRPSDGAAIQRQGKHDCSGGSNGPLEPCSGSACMFGPNGFSRAVVTPPDPGDYWGVTANCGALEYTSPPTPIWPNVMGTFPRNQGCPGSSAGSGDWDY